MYIRAVREINGRSEGNRFMFVRAIPSDLIAGEFRYQCCANKEAEPFVDNRCSRRIDNP